MKTVSDTTFLSQLKNEEEISFEKLYKLYFPTISGYVLNNMGTKEDAEDIFQEVIIVLLHKVREHDFKLTSKLNTYLVAITRNIWLKHLRDNKVITVSDFDKFPLDTEVFNTELKPEKTKEEKVNSWLKQITAHCQHILKAIFFQNETIESLMIKMGWRNRHVASNLQYKCIQQIKREIEKERIV
jgi:RNA polymerase sigma factor (sigma-70 family)